MSTDPEAIIYGLLSANWNTTYAAKPQILPIADNQPQRKFDYPHSIKVYQPGNMTFTPQGLSYASEGKSVRVTVDLQGNGRALILSQVDEIRRALLQSRKNPGSTLSPADYTFDYLILESTIKQSGYSGFYHYTVDVILKRSSQAIS